MATVFTPVPGYEGRYELGDNGKLRSLIGPRPKFLKLSKLARSYALSDGKGDVWQVSLATLRLYVYEGLKFPKGALRGTDHPASLLTPDDVKEIRRRDQEEITSATSMGAEFGVSSGTIHAVLKRRTWRHVT